MPDRAASENGGPMKLDRIQVRGFKSLRELDLELRSLNVLIGPNGAGKSNFISLFRLLQEMIRENFQLTVRRAGGAESFLYLGQKTTDEIRIDLTFAKGHYQCIWVPTVNDELAFAHEVLSDSGGGASWRTATRIGVASQETRLLEEAARTDRWGRVVVLVAEALRDWRVYHFHDTSDSAPVKRLASIHDNSSLRGDASNLAPVLLRLRESAPDQYRLIIRTIQQVAPFFRDFVLRPTLGNGEKVRLEWEQQGSDYPFLPHQLSDGTLRFICLATLLLQPELPSTVLIDEPELGLHPYAVGILAGLIRSASTRTQVIVSTQSVSLVDEFEPEDLLVVEHRDQATTMKRMSVEQLEGWLNEYTLGELWQKNILGGRP